MSRGVIQNIDKSWVKVIQNSSGQWVMWMHIDSSNYGEAKVGIATSSSICGSYKYVRSFQPLGRQSRDMGLFKDDDGSGYLLTEDVSSSQYYITVNLITLS